MNILQCSMTEIRRRLGKYIILFMAFVIIYSSLMIGLNLRATVVNIKDQIVDKIGTFFQLDFRDECNEEISEEWINDFININHVTGVNRNYIEYALPVNFTNVKDYIGMAPDTDSSLYEGMEGLTPDSVTLDANIDCNFTDDFRLGDSVLIEGRMPENGSLEVVISEEMAENNSYIVGDTLALKSNFNENIIAQIVGIYKTKGTFEITNDNSVGEAVFAWSPYNHIYSSINVAEKLYDININKIPVSVYVDKFKHMEEVGAEIKKSNINWEKYVLYNMTESLYKYDKLASQIENMDYYSVLIMGYTVIIGIVLISLLLNFYIQLFIEEAGILIAIGSNKVRVVFQHLISVGFVSIISIIISTIISYFLSVNILNFIESSTRIEWSETSSFQNGIIHAGTIIPSSMTYAEWGMFIAGVVIIVGVSALPLVWKLFRYHPREIMLKEV